MAIRSAGRMALDADDASGGDGISFAFELEEPVEVLIVASIFLVKGRCDHFDSCEMPQMLEHLLCEESPRSVGELMKCLFELAAQLRSARSALRYHYEPSVRTPDDDHLKPILILCLPRRCHRAHWLPSNTAPPPPPF